MIDLSTLENIYTVGKKIYDIVQSIKKAPEAIRELGTQVLLVTSVLEALKDADAGPIDWSTEPRRRILERARELAEQAEGFLEKATKATKEDARRKVRNWRWILSDEADAKELTEKFHKFHGSLNTVVLLRSSVIQQPTELVHSSHNIHADAQHLRTEQHLMLELVMDRQTETHQMLQRVLAAVEAKKGDRGVEGKNLVDSGPTSSPSVIYNDGRSRSTKGSDTTVSGSIIEEIPGSPRYNIGHCGPNCKCQCHSTAISILPLLFTSIFSQSQPLVECDKTTCKRLQRMTFSVLRAFKQITAEVWIEGQSLTHVSLRIPRVVGQWDLYWLQTATINEIRRKLSNRELTVNDVMPDGQSVLHNVTVRLTFDQSDAALSIVALLAEHSAPTDWEHEGLTFTENALWFSLVHWRRYSSPEAAFNAVKFRLGPYLPQDIDDAHEGLAIKLRWSGLHQCFCGLSSPVLTDIPPGMVSQVNVRDSLGRTPLFYAMLVSPGATCALLRAGANPRLFANILIWACRAGADTAISALVRAGAYINASDVDDHTALHWTANINLLYSIDGLAVALELVRHAGYLLDWGVRDHSGYTPLDWAQYRAHKNPDDEDSMDILELYCTRRLPGGAQYLPTPPIVDAEDEGLQDDTTGLPSTSLVRAGLRGDLEAIGDLIHRGAMVNERDHEGRTLLHLVALGFVPNGYRVALELVRHGGWGVDWGALVAMTIAIDEDEGVQSEAGNESDDRVERLWEDQTGGVCNSHEEGDDEKKPSVWCSALAIAESRLTSHELNAKEREELEKVRDLLEARRLPPDEEYLWPCMDPDFYNCMPGAWE